MSVAGEMRRLKTEICSNLPDPPWWKVEALSKVLKDTCLRVVEKVGLERMIVKSLVIFTIYAIFKAEEKECGDT